MHDVIVIGSGPAGLTAALYTARANLDTRVISGLQVGGQVSITWEVDNYPGFTDNPSGAELTERFVRHAEKFGAQMVLDEVTAVDFTGFPLKVTTHGGLYEARAVIVAAGASARRLGVPGEEAYIGRGVSYCATCDGAFFKGNDVVVVGGGDSAIEEALFLTRFANTVTVVHRRGELRAGPGLQARAMQNDKIRFRWNTVVAAIRANGQAEGERSLPSVALIDVKDVETGQTDVIDAQGIFIFIGHYPNSEVFREVLEMDEHGYVIVDDHMRTSAPGVFAAGEIMDPLWRQIATSVGQGCAAGMAAETYIGALGN